MVCINFYDLRDGENRPEDADCVDSGVQRSQPKRARGIRFKAFLSSPDMRMIVRDHLAE